VNADLYRLMAFYSFAKATEEANPTLRSNFESAARAYLRMAEQAPRSVVTPEPAPKQDKPGPPG
jgi:hypothetical protein